MAREIYEVSGTGRFGNKSFFFSKDGEVWSESVAVTNKVSDRVKMRKEESVLVLRDWRCWPGPRLQLT